MARFKHVISLGYFCSPALELRRIRVRDGSYPFDWVISYDFASVLYLVENHFEDLLSEDLLYQLKELPNCYRNKKFKVDFYHDFDELKKLRGQLFKVKEKYNRRVNRFYNSIKQPTLFIRYISSPEELLYINNNYEKIQTLFKQFNPNNEVHYVANSDLYSEENSNINIWYVEKDKCENVARRFLEKNDQLEKYILDNVEYRADNTFKPFLNHQSVINRMYRKVCAKLKLHYRHNQTVAHSDR